jgi:hypothetical protein
MISIIYMKFAMGDRAATTFDPPFGKGGAPRLFCAG